MGYKYILTILLLIIFTNLIKSQTHLHNLITNWKLEKNDFENDLQKLKETGRYKIKRARFYHGKKNRYVKNYLFNDSLEIRFVKSKLFGRYYLRSILIKYPMLFTTKDNIKVGITGKEELLNKFGKPQYEYGCEYFYNGDTYFFPDSINVSYPLDYDKVKHLKDKIISIKFTKSGNWQKKKVGENP